jgi:hypothetical protein
MSAEPSMPIVTRLSTAVTGAIRQAASATGASFDYLLATAKVESDLDPNLTMKSSSATGLFQFLEQTWLGVLKDTGRVFGYGRYADAITQTGSGRYLVSDPALREEIMALRKDPTANAVMGGAITQQNAAVLARRIGRQPTDGELYVAHFFGPYAGSKVINLASTHPNANAAAMFPRAAAANRPIFYDKQGNARSVVGVYSELVRRYKVASASAGRAIAGLPSGTQPVRTAAVTATAPGVAGTPSALFALSPVEPRGLSPGRGTQTTATLEPSGPVFHSLFHSGERQGPVAPLVAQLWGAGATQTDLASTAADAAAAMPPGSGASRKR